MLGLNRSGDYHNGFSVNLPIAFGNLINMPVNFGNPVNTPVSFGNRVTLPKNFGNLIGTENAPTFSPAAGSYGPAQNVAIIPFIAGDLILYTIDGSTPNPESEIYTGPIAVASTTTIKAIAFNPELGFSAVASATYTINGACGTPLFSPVAGSYGPTQSVTITSTNSTAIWYTTDGSTPTYPATGATQQYTGAITVSATETIKAIGVAAGYSNSAVGSAAYTINGPCGTPSFSPAAGTYTSVQSVTITSANATELYYTTDGSTPTIPPTGTSTLYSSPVSVGVSETLKAIGGATGYNNSAVGSAAYTINLGPTYAAANYPSSGGPATQTLSIPIPAGATVIVSTGSYNGGSAAALSVTDSSGGNTYAETVSYAGSYPGFGTWTSANVTHAATSVTCTSGNGYPITIISVIVIPAGGAVGATGLNNNGSSASLTTTANGATVLGIFMAYEALGSWTNTGSGTVLDNLAGTSGQGYPVMLVSDSVPSSGTNVTMSGNSPGSFPGVNMVEIK